jgi:hypothetical protein
MSHVRRAASFRAAAVASSGPAVRQGSVPHLLLGIVDHLGEPSVERPPLGFGH